MRDKTNARQRQYQFHLRSQKWKMIRKAVLERAGYKCEQCDRRLAEHIHHITYERLGDELLDDLKALCIPCHKTKHPHHKFRSHIHEQKAVETRRRIKRRNKKKKQAKALKARVKARQKIEQQKAHRRLTFGQLAEMAQKRIQEERSVTVSSSRPRRTDANNSTGGR